MTVTNRGLAVEINAHLRVRVLDHVELEDARKDGFVWSVKENCKATPERAVVNHARVPCAELPQPREEGDGVGVAPDGGVHRNGFVLAPFVGAGALGAAVTTYPSEGR